MIREHPRDIFGAYPVSQELVDDIKTMVGLVVDGSSKFADEYDACQSILEKLTLDFAISCAVPCKITDYMRAIKICRFCLILAALAEVSFAMWAGLWGCGVGAVLTRLSLWSDF